MVNPTKGAVLVLMVGLCLARLSFGQAGGGSPAPFSPSPVLQRNADNLTNASGGGQKINAPNSPSPSNSGNVQGDTGQYGAPAVGERLVNSDNLGVDFQNGIVTWRNIKFDIGNNLMVRTRFERYLSSPGYAEDTSKQYLGTMDKIVDLLSVSAAGTETPADSANTTDDSNTTVTGTKVYQAWTLLTQASKFGQDGGASQTVADMVWNAWRVRDELAGNHQERLMTEGSQDVLQAKLQGDFSRAIDEQNDAEQSAKAGGASDSVGKYALTALQNKPTAQGANNPSALGSYGTDGILGGVLTHSEGSGPVQGAEALPPPSSITEIVPNAPTYLSFDSMGLAKTYAKEALLDAQAGAMGTMAKIQYQTQLLSMVLERRFEQSLIAAQFYDHLFKGSEQRMQVGENMIKSMMNIDNFVPTVNAFEHISREAVSETNESMKSVEAAYDNGERWTALQQLQSSFLLGEMLPAVQNFDPAKRHVLWGVYQEANKLKNAIDIRDFASAEDHVKKIRAIADDFDYSTPMSAIRIGEQESNMALMSAQRAMLNGETDVYKNYMETAIKAWPLNPALGTLNQAGGDAVLQMMTAYADEALKQNNPYASWEALDRAQKIDPSNADIARKKSDLAPRVATFISQIDSAQRAAQTGQYAESLSHYLAAQDIYPASQMAHDGIESTGLRILAKINPNGGSAKALDDLQAKEAANAALQNAAMAMPATSVGSSATSNPFGSSSTAPASNPPPTTNQAPSASSPATSVPSASNAAKPSGNGSSDSKSLLF